MCIREPESLAKSERESQTLDLVKLLPVKSADLRLAMVTVRMILAMQALRYH